MNTPIKLLLDSYQELHAMEVQVARSLPVLSGSVMNVRLRKLLTELAFRTRDRRDWLADQVIHHGDLPVTRMRLAISGILTAGNNDLAETRNPFMRDLLMIRHCIRIIQHVSLGYGSVSRLADSAGVPADGRCLASFLSELEVAGMRLKAIESELCPSTLFHRAHAGRMKKKADLPRGNRTLKPKLTKNSDESQ